MVSQIQLIIKYLIKCKLSQNLKNIINSQSITAYVTDDYFSFSWNGVSCSSVISAFSPIFKE